MKTIGGVMTLWLDGLTPSQRNAFVIWLLAMFTIANLSLFLHIVSVFLREWRGFWQWRRERKIEARSLPHGTWGG